VGESRAAVELTKKQRVYKTKEEMSAPTACVESLFKVSCEIDAKEHLKVITCDIPGAFMQADISMKCYT
jgi:hypothetical protein